MFATYFDALNLRLRFYIASSRVHAPKLCEKLESKKSKRDSSKLTHQSRINALWRTTSKEFWCFISQNTLYDFNARRLCTELQHVFIKCQWRLVANKATAVFSSNKISISTFNNTKAKAQLSTTFRANEY